MASPYHISCEILRAHHSNLLNLSSLLKPGPLLLSVQGFNVTLLEAGPQPGGLVAGWKTDAGRSVEVGIHGERQVACET